MKKISLTQGKFALVDDEDFDELSKYKWYAHKSFNTFYAERQVRVEQGRGNRQKPMKMHIVILGTPSGMLTDHIDGDGLNNQRINLRIATFQENCRNTRKYKNNSTGFKGVIFQDKKYRPRIMVSGKSISLGMFEKKEDAYQAYCDACIKYHGEFANVG